jgi:hypothetical protein
VNTPWRVTNPALAFADGKGTKRSRPYEQGITSMSRLVRALHFASALVAFACAPASFAQAGAASLTGSIMSPGAEAAMALGQYDRGLLRSDQPPASVPTGYRFGFSLRGPIRFERYGHGWAKYSFDVVEATWYRYGATTGLAFQRSFYNVSDDVHVDAGLAWMRVARVRPDVTGGAADTVAGLFPVVSIEFKRALRMNMVVAPPAGERAPVAMARLAWKF